jgi:hypothetical protein
MSKSDIRFSRTIWNCTGRHVSLTSVLLSFLASKVSSYHDFSTTKKPKAAIMARQQHPQEALLPVHNAQKVWSSAKRLCSSNLQRLNGNDDPKKGF